MHKLVLSLLSLPLAAAAPAQAGNELTRTCHGIAIPLSALRSKKDCGIGEFYDAIDLIDWCKEAKINVIQFLPLNDTGTDPSPYNPISSCALHPIYLSLDTLPYLEQFPELKEDLSSFAPLNGLKRVSYHEVQEKKLSWLRSYYQYAGPFLMKEEGYSRFVQENSWLEPYSLFKALKDAYREASWTDWPSFASAPSKEDYFSLLNQYSYDVSFYSVLQYLASCQLKKVKEYAASKNILLKGDISILISRDSADCWSEGTLFDFSLAAGAPPDKHYNEEGQYWGFPLFNWEAMRSDGYRWWKRRIANASKYFDLYRIDHATGFFRLWAIPLNGSPRDGKYLPEDPKKWLPQGREILGACYSNS